jgi:hypothetical protein
MGPWPCLTSLPLHPQGLVPPQSRVEGIHHGYGVFTLIATRASPRKTIIQEEKKAWPINRSRPCSRLYTVVIVRGRRVTRLRLSHPILLTGTTHRALQTPPPLTDLLAKDVFDLAFQGFLRTRVSPTDLCWIHDQSWRLTEPCVAPIGSGLSYGVHPVVRVYYSPDGRQGYGSRI